MGRQPKPDKNAKARQAIRREKFRAILARTAAGRAKLDAEYAELVRETGDPAVVITPAIIEASELVVGADEPACPGPDCLLCNGEACNLCGAGCWNNALDLHCEHAVDERHLAPRQSTRVVDLIAKRPAVFDVHQGRVVEQTTKSVGTSNKPAPPKPPKSAGPKRRINPVRHCSACSKPGHYASTCPDEPNVTRETIANALVVAKGNISAAARHLGIQRQSLQRQLRLMRSEATTQDDVAAPEEDTVRV
jgi:hypothetical protein